MELDHVAIADRDVLPLLDHLVAGLGATVMYGGETVGFRPIQVRVGDAHAGVTVELLEPWRVEENDFLERFLTRSGPGPHHITYKVDDIEAVLRYVHESGFTPVNVSIDNPVWREAFLHPRETHGTVVQFAEDHADHPKLAEVIDAARSGRPYDTRMGRWWPEPAPRHEEAGVLRAIVIGTPVLREARSFYEGFLRGREVVSGDGWVELTWPKGSRLRLVERPGPPAVDWLDVRMHDETTHGERVVSGTRFVVRAPDDPHVT